MIFRENEKVKNSGWKTILAENLNKCRKSVNETNQDRNIYILQATYASTQAQQVRIKFSIMIQNLVQILLDVIEVKYQFLKK